MSRRLFLLPLLALAAVLPFVDALVAQPPKKAKGTQWAILIAGARYAHLQKIPGEETINDILEFKKALNATGFTDEHIVLMHDRQADVRNGGQGNEYLPEHDKIVDMLGKFLKGMDEEDTVLVVLSGHGVLFKGDKFGYFCPVDAKLDPKTKLIPMEGPGGIYTLLEKCKAGRKLLISNTCRNAPSVARPVDLAGDKIELEDDYPELTRVPKGIAAFYSCEPTQKSHFDPDRKRSLFFIHLTDAWQGGAELEAVFKKTKDATKADALKTYSVEQFPVKKVNYEGEWTIAAAIAPPADRKGGEEVEFEIAQDVKMRFCWIPKLPGKVKLGAPKEEAGRDSDDLPERDYEEPKGFWLGKYAVTQGEWTGVMGTNPSYFVPTQADLKKANIADTGRFPVENVSFDDICGKGWKDGDAPLAGSFLAKVNGRAGIAAAFGTGAKFRLPHEDRWEYAYRGGEGNKKAYYWGDVLNGDKANCDGNYPFGTETKGEYLQRPTAVGAYASKAKHPWGLCDMSGNVWQWCENKYSNDGTSRVLRGGSWCYLARYCRAALRDHLAPDARGHIFGFRVCVVLD